MKRKLPNTLTFLRIALIPAVLLLFFMPWEFGRVAAAWVFGLAAVTDWFDGYLARRWNVTSPLGAFLDPVADKLMVAAALLVLVADKPTVWLTVPALVIIGREITISALREWMAEIGARNLVAVSWVGKVKTSVQMGAIFFMLHAGEPFGLPVYPIGFWLLYLATALTLWSMIIYVRAAWPKLMA